MINMGVDKQSGRTTYRVRFYDHRRIRRALSGFKKKGDSESLHRSLRRLVDNVNSNSELPEDLAVWLNKKLDPVRREKLIEWGIITRYQVMVGQSLAKHLDAWRQHMIDNNVTEAHADQDHKRVVLLFEPYNSYAELDAGLLKSRLALLAKRGRRNKPWAELTKRHYLAAAKAFCNWMVRFGRDHQNPLTVLPLVAVPRKMYGKQRRALTDKEIIKLLITTRNSEEVRGGMCGEERSLFYRFAIETGYRASAIDEMQVRHIHLADDMPWIEAPKVKRDQGGHKTRVDIPISAGLAAALRDHVSKKLPATRLFNSPSIGWYADMLKRDLITARINYQNIDFHALRHTRATQLVRAGIGIEHARDLLGHQEIKTTADVYTHIGRRDLAREIGKLPEINLTPIDDKPHTAEGGDT